MIIYLTNYLTLPLFTSPHHILSRKTRAKFTFVYSLFTVFTVLLSLREGGVASTAPNFLYNIEIGRRDVSEEELLTLYLTNKSRTYMTPY